MKDTLIHTSESGERTFVIVFDPGDEVVSGLEAFARREQVFAASLTALGALSSATLGYFDLETETYLPIEVPDQTEVLSLIGNIAELDGQPKLHPHMVLGRRDGSTVGGHLLKGTVRPTLEVILREEPAHLQRRVDPRFGIPLIKLPG